MENQKQPAKSLQTTSTKPSRQGPAHSGELFAGSTSEIVGRLNKPETMKSRIPELQDQESELMTGVFARMKSIYGHLWSSNWTGEAQLAIAKLDWLTALRRENFTLGEVNSTLDYCASKVPDMPNLPRFLGIARQERRRITRERANARGHLCLPETPAQAQEREAEDAAERARYREIAKTGMADIKNIF